MLSSPIDMSFIYRLLESRLMLNLYYTYNDRKYEVSFQIQFVIEYSYFIVLRFMNKITKRGNKICILRKLCKDTIKCICILLTLTSFV